MRKAGSTFDNCTFLKIVTFLAVLVGCSCSAIIADIKEDRFCVMHVGPHKTSSSTLQAFFYHALKSGDLMKDNYRFPLKSDKIPMKSHSYLAACLNRVHSRLESKCSDETFRIAVLDYFQSFVNDAANGDSNVIISSEDFVYPGLNLTELTSYLVPRHQYKIHVVVYYRRLYDWIYSYYNQFTKLKNAQKIAFAEWLTDEIFEDSLLGYSVAAYNRFKDAPGIFNVSVVNMHVDEDPDNFNTIARFVCEHMDQAPNLCEIAKSENVEHRNPSVDIDWIIFREKISLYHPIQLSESDQRWEQIEVKFYKMTDVPRLCLSSEWKNKLLQSSLESEVALTPEWWHNGKEGLENLKSDFEEKVNSLLCSIDIDKVLISAEWQNFLSGLEEDEVEVGF